MSTVLDSGTALGTDIRSSASGSIRRQLVADRYVVLERIGSGGMADVYRARDRRLSRDVAIKIFRTAARTVAERLRHEREIRILAELRHPGVVELFDTGETMIDDEVRRYIVMELVPGHALRLEGDAPIDPTRTAVIGSQIARALALVHSESIVHRDVKPDNILVDDAASMATAGAAGPRATLVDFGVAHIVNGSHLTDADQLIGTAAYISPEQVLGDEVDGSSDVYSLGLVLLECLTGAREFTGPPVEAALHRLRRDPVVPSALGSGWSTLLTAMTAREPGDRPSATDVATMLDALALDRSTIGVLPSESVDTAPTFVPAPSVLPALAPEPFGRRTGQDGVGLGAPRRRRESWVDPDGEAVETGVSRGSAAVLAIACGVAGLAIGVATTVSVLF